MGYIPQSSLDNLNKYTYKGVDKSWLSNNVLNPFWNWFVTLWPTTIAPNTITLIGLTAVGLNFLTMLAYDPAYLAEKGGATGPPLWIYYTWAVGLFFYQSMDAIDGKQARRTGMAGPLGEMFDHGCDAINTTLEVLLCCQALNLGRSWWTIASQIATLANFYLTTWEEYHTGILFLGNFSGPVEGILMIVAIFSITGYFGPTFWDQGILTITGLDYFSAVDEIVPNIGLNEAFMAFGGVALFYNVWTSYMNVYRAQPKGSKGRSKPLLYLLPFLFTVILHVVWLARPSVHASAILHTSLCLPFICAWGLQFAHTVGRMILAHLTKESFPIWDPMWLWTAVCAIDANLPTFLGRPPILQTTHARTAALVYMTLAFSLFTYVRFVLLVIGDITNHLGIACLTVRKRDANGQWMDAGIVNNQKKQ